MSLKLLLWLVFLLSATLPLPGQTPVTAAGGAQPDEMRLRRQSFEKVWTTVYEKHFNPTFGGVDWRKVREIYEPQALSAKTSGDFHAVLRRMLGELKLSHFGIFSPEAQIPIGPGSGTIGVELKLIDEKTVITRIEKKSAAEAAGLKTGFVITKIDGRVPSELLTPLEKYLGERNGSEFERKTYRERVLLNLLGGQPGSIARLEVLDEKDQTRVFEVTRSAVRAEMSEAVGNFPPQEEVFEARRLDNKIGYIRFNLWGISQMTKIRRALADYTDAPGIIFDLRGNPGGLGALATGVAGLLVTNQISLGSMKGRETDLKFIAYPQANAFRGKVVVLIDSGTASTSEIFAAGLQEIGRAVIVGERSAGAVLPSVFETLPTGALFQYAISDYRSPKNVLIEGRGVVPDLEVKTTRAALLEGCDLPLEAAIQQIKK